LSGFINQTYLEEKQGAPGAIGENIYGNITIDKSPSDMIAIISNRYDGMFGQTSGDSAVGTSVVLGIAKYFKDHPSVKPKYNLTFLFTTAEEYGFHGARFHCDNHSNQSIKYWLVLDQLGFDQEDCKLLLEYNDTHNPIPNFNKILDEIIKDSGYPEGKILKRTGKELSSGSEQGTIDESELDCTTLHLGKDQDRRWDHWHRTGNNYTEGDSIKNIDRDDVNATARLTLGLVKYFMINPDCRFDGSITYTMVDSPNDSDAVNDSINATFFVKTSLPNDKARVRAIMKNQSNDTKFWKDFDFYATSEGVEKTIMVTLPPTIPCTGEKYHLYLQLFNSTERINETVAGGSGKYNDTDSQPNWNNTLYPRGNTNATKPNDIQGPHTLKVLETGIFNSSTTDPNNDQLQYQWDWGIDTGCAGPYASGVVCTKDHTYILRGDKTIMVNVREDYKGQLYDGGLEDNYRYGNWSQWSDPFSVHVDQLIDFDFVCTAAASAQSATQSTMLPSVLKINSIYNGFAFGGTAPYNYSWYFENVELPEREQTVAHNFSQPGIKTVTLSVTDDNNSSEEITVNITVVNISASYNVSLPSLYTVLGETIIFNDTSAVINNRSLENWTWDFGDDTVCYEQNASHSYYCPGLYNVSLTVTDNRTETDTYVQTIIVDDDDTPPMITSVFHSPDKTGFGSNISIVVEVIDNISGVNTVYTNITKPDTTTVTLPMMHIIDNYYYALFNDTWQNGDYNYSIWAIDYTNNTNYANGFDFTVSAEANITVCTTKDTYTDNEFINLTDPPGTHSPALGYELLDDGTVLHLWNHYDNYYFNISSGIQLTNHKDEYWSHNVMMLGYYNNDQWHLLYRTDELTGFSRSIETDNSTYVNVTLWKDLSYAGYPFRLALRYHLGVDDNDLTIIPSIKNLGTTTIPYVLGFGWELKDIQINTTTEGDYIVIDQESYSLNQTLNNTYTDLHETMFSLMDDSTDTQTQSLYLRWDPNLIYKLQVKSRTGQQNAPVTLFIRIGTLAVGQQKSTIVHWYDASQMTYQYTSYDVYEAWDGDPENMVDGSTETFAFTHTNEDLQVCNGNTCPGSNLGTIQKVELRAHCYKEGEAANLTLQPVLEEDTGQNYTTSPGGEPEWTPWFDITTDFGHDSGEFSTPWTWEEIKILCCTVRSSMVDGMLFCSMVEIRVTYNTAPIVSDPYPPYGVNGVGLQPWLSINVTDPDEDTMNVSWYTNATYDASTWMMFGSNSSVQNGTIKQFENATENGQWWYWKVKVEDGTSTTWSSVYKFYTGYQSKIENTGETNISGYLLMQVQYYNTSQSKWLVDDDIINKTTARTITSGNQLGLDTIFNRQVRASDLTHGTGSYRVYTALRDPEGTILKTNTGAELKAWWQFTKA